MVEERYITLEKPAEIEYTERKSVFLGFAAPVKNEDAVAAFLRERRELYPDATHHVFGYSMKNGVLARYSDDGEPQGTAGMPVLEAVRKSGADDALCVVTRYFGGILLGAGGLVRAYAHAAHLALETAHIVTYQKYQMFTLACSYSDYGKYQAALPRYGAIADGTDFADRVTLNFAVPLSEAEKVCALVQEVSAGADEAKCVGERFDYPHGQDKGGV